MDLVCQTEMILEACCFVVSWFVECLVVRERYVWLLCLTWNLSICLLEDKQRLKCGGVWYNLNCAYFSNWFGSTFVLKCVNLPSSIYTSMLSHVDMVLFLNLVHLWYLLVFWDHCRPNSKAREYLKICLESKWVENVYIEASTRPGFQSTRPEHPVWSSWSRPQGSTRREHPVSHSVLKNQGSTCRTPVSTHRESCAVQISALRNYLFFPYFCSHYIRLIFPKP